MGWSGVLGGCVSSRRSLRQRREFSRLRRRGGFLFNILEAWAGGAVVCPLEWTVCPAMVLAPGCIASPAVVACAFSITLWVMRGAGLLQHECW